MTDKHRLYLPKILEEFGKILIARPSGRVGRVQDFHLLDGPSNTSKQFRLARASGGNGVPRGRPTFCIPRASLLGIRESRSDEAPSSFPLMGVREAHGVRFPSPGVFSCLGIFPRGYSVSSSSNYIGSSELSDLFVPAPDEIGKLTSGIVPDCGFAIRVRIVFSGGLSDNAII